MAAAKTATAVTHETDLMNWHPASEHPDILTVVEGITQDGTLTPAIWTGSDWRCAKTGAPLTQWRWSSGALTERLERE